MKEDTWEKLDAMFQKHSILKAEAVPLQEINESAVQIGIPLPSDYVEFIHRYGGAIVGPFPIFGLRKAKPMGNEDGSFVEVTAQFRRQRWPGTERWIVISSDHAGNPVGLDGNGQVWISDHDAGVVEVIADNFEDYLRKRCLKMPD